MKTFGSEQAPTQANSYTGCSMATFLVDKQRPAAGNSWGWSWSSFLQTGAKYILPRSLAKTFPQDHNWSGSFFDSAKSWFSVSVCNIHMVHHRILQLHLITDHKITSEIGPLPPQPLPRLMSCSEKQTHTLLFSHLGRKG